MEQMIDHIKSWLEEAGEKIQSSQQNINDLAKIKSNGFSDKC